MGSIVSTLSSFLNVFSVFYVEAPTADRCLLFCTFDVMVNVLVMNYLISSSSGKQSQSSDASTMHTMYKSSFKNKKVACGENAVSHMKVHPTSEADDLDGESVVTAEDEAATLTTATSGAEAVEPSLAMTNQAAARHVLEMEHEEDEAV